MRQAKRRKTGLRWDKNGTGTGREREAIGHSNGTRSAGSTTSRGRANAVANPIYREAIPRSLAGAALTSLPQLQPTWLDADGVLDEGRLLAAFLDFWRQHGEPLLASAPYHEVAPYLVLMAGW